MRSSRVDDFPYYFLLLKLRKKATMFLIICLHRQVQHTSLQRQTSQKHLQVLFILGILKAAAVQVIPARSPTAILFQIFKRCFPTVVYEVPRFLWRVWYTLDLFKAGVFELPLMVEDAMLLVLTTVAASSSAAGSDRSWLWGTLKQNAQVPPLLGKEVDGKRLAGVTKRTTSKMVCIKVSQVQVNRCKVQIGDKKELWRSFSRTLFSKWQEVIN